ncbi:hypothetical protein P8C59_009150 [Phyllachora maydis]|uniref:Amino acid transporter transmembrane domain-containing protein n=1 Tax=Phyllachora maydis TaxID=1825666 RepID=A0AAD9MHY7_9PEZI|nr:hypothetical protein P8C59_009150 [Phyllachora maydis]
MCWSATKIDFQGSGRTEILRISKIQRAMTGYDTIAHGSARTSTEDGDMARQRGGRSSKAKPGGGQATMTSSNINLINTIIGAGTLAVPLALSHFGIVFGVLLIIWCGLTAACGLYLQSRCARYLDRGTSSFFALSQLTYPNAAVFFDGAIAIKCFGVGVSYMIIIGDLMPGVVLGFVPDEKQVFPFLLQREFWITAFMLLIIPLAFLRRLDSLKYTSVIALLAIGYLVVLVVYHFSSDPQPIDRGDLHIFKWAGPISALGSLPVIIFAYTCHQNMFSILNEIKDDSPRSTLAVIASSIGSAASIYILVAITGYLTFGNRIAGNIVLMYPPSLASTIGRAAIVVLVLFSIPLQVHPCRASLDAVLRWRPNKQFSPHPNRTVLAGHQSLLPSVSHGAAGAALDSHGSPAALLSEQRFAVLTSVILMCSYATALEVSSLDRVLAYVGSTGSTTISFILPGLFYYKISDPEGIHHQRLIKEDDDAELSDEDGDGVAGRSPGPEVVEGASGGLLEGIGEAAARPQWRGRRRWRWDLEHLETVLLRKMALSLAVYGFLVMATCLVVNTFFVTSGGH